MSVPPPVPARVVKKLEELLARVRETDLAEPTAAVLATASAEGRPSSRTILLKGLGPDGFVFYTNLRSRKGEQLFENPWGALTFYWPPLARQVQAEGPVELVPDAEADAYWATRSRDSRIGAWASRQSEPLPGRGELLKRVAGIAARHPVGKIPRPEFWSGFRLRPERVEFWTSKVHRLHERVLWVVEDGEWVKRNLFP